MDIKQIQPGSRFVAIDVEQAAQNQNVYQLGLAVVKDNRVVDSRSWHIQLTESSLDDIGAYEYGAVAAEENRDFAQLWSEIQPYLLEGQVWTHNANSAGLSAFKKMMLEYGITADWLCINDSRDLFQMPENQSNDANGLAQRCAALKIPYDENEQHQAQYNAVKCAEVIIAHGNGQLPG